MEDLWIRSWRSSTLCVPTPHDRDPYSLGVGLGVEGLEQQLRSLLLNCTTLRGVADWSRENPSCLIGQEM